MKPTNEELKALKVGDRITFKAITRNNNRKATRKIDGFWLTGEPTVRFEGAAGFIVHWHEITAIEAA